MSDSTFWIRFVLAVLATWRITHLLAREDGPADLIVRFRHRLGSGFAGRLLDCFYCLSLWVAAPLSALVARNPAEAAVTWVALSGAACLLERIGEPPVFMEPLHEPGQEGEHDVLRTEENHDGYHLQPAGSTDARETARR
jgi:hypothetical protein